METSGRPSLSPVKDFSPWCIPDTGDYYYYSSYHCCYHHYHFQSLLIFDNWSCYHQYCHFLTCSSSSSSSMLVLACEGFWLASMGTLVVQLTVVFEIYISYFLFSGIRHLKLFLRSDQYPLQVHTSITSYFWPIYLPPLSSYLGCWLFIYFAINSPWILGRY